MKRFTAIEGPSSGFFKLLFRKQRAPDDAFRFALKGVGRQRTSQFKLNKLVMFLAMAGA